MKPTLNLALVQRPGPLTDNIFEMAFGALRGHWGFMREASAAEASALLEGCFPTNIDEVSRLEALCRKCAEFGCRAELRLGDPRGAILSMHPLES